MVKVFCDREVTVKSQSTDSQILFGKISSLLDLKGGGAERNSARDVRHPVVSEMISRLGGDKWGICSTSTQNTWKLDSVSKTLMNWNRSTENHEANMTVDYASQKEIHLFMIFHAQFKWYNILSKLYMQH